MITRNIVFIALLLFGSQQDQEGWKKALDKEGITIHTRKVDGSPFHEFLAETSMPGTIPAFKKIFSDVSNYIAWMPDCKSAELINMQNENEFAYYMELKVPFPIADRYTLQNVRYSETPGELTVSLVNCENCQTPETGSVKIESAYGSWIVRQENKNEISIRFQYYADPGGDLPAWLVNSFIEKSPYKTLLLLREVLADQ